MCGPAAPAIAPAAVAGFTGGTTAFALGTGGAAAAASSGGILGGLFSGMSMFEMVSLGLSVGGMGLQTLGSYRAAGAQKGADEYMARVHADNARISEQNARNLETQGDTEVKQHRLKISQLIGTQRSLMGASNVELDSGSPLDTQVDTATIGEMDVETIKENTRLAAHGERMRGWEATTRGQMASASAANNSPLLSAGTNLLAGAGSVADRWYRYRKA